eukprot:1183931-Prorocentrum_minimum.AAC.3
MDAKGWALFAASSIRGIRSHIRMCTSLDVQGRDDRVEPARAVGGIVEVVGVREVRGGVRHSARVVHELQIVRRLQPPLPLRVEPPAALVHHVLWRGTGGGRGANQGLHLGGRFQGWLGGGLLSSALAGTRQCAKKGDHVMRLWREDRTTGLVIHDHGLDLSVYPSTIPVHSVLAHVGIYVKRRLSTNIISCFSRCHPYEKKTINLEAESQSSQTFTSSNPNHQNH